MANAQGMRVAIYARVSSDDQADRNFSIPAQLEACRYYAQGKGWTVVGLSVQYSNFLQPGLVPRLRQLLAVHGGWTQQGDG